MKSNKSSFVLGLIGSIGGAVISLYMYVVVSLLLAAFSLGGKNSILINFTEIAIYINLVSNIISFIGSFFFLKKPRIGSIIMFISFVLYILVYICAVILSGIFNIIIPLLIAIIPSLFILSSAILGLRKNKTELKEQQ